MQSRQQNSVSFFTCTYEADWEYLLVEGRLNELIKRFNYSFASRNLIINNVLAKEKVKQYAQLAVNNNIIDKFYFSEDIISEVLHTFSLKRKNFKLDGFDGYWFSVAPLTAVFLCDSDYLLYCTADCMLTKIDFLDWINQSIFKLKNNKIFIVTPLWNYYNAQKDKFNYEDGLCFYDNGFSDQLFIAITKKLRSVNYKEYNPKSEIFPIYGGNHFERKIFCYMNNRDLERCVFKDIIYRHEILIKPGYIREIGSGYVANKLRYIIAKAKRKFRKKNILVKLLLR